jgi:hypothetical protein
MHSYKKISLHRVKEKCMAKPTKDEPRKTHQHRPSEAWFPNYSLRTIKENIQSVHLEFRCSWSVTRFSPPVTFTAQNSKAAGSLSVAN